MKNRYYFTLMVLLFITYFKHNTYAQNSYKISGILKDDFTGEVIKNVTVKIIGTDVISKSDSNGVFKINKIGFNRIRLMFSAENYQEYKTDILTLDRYAFNHYVFNLSQNNKELKGIEVFAKRFDASEPSNPLSYVSTRSFSADDTEHIPASVNDPGRMALSFMGVQVGRDENENKIIIRGNSPQGVLWRVEGIDVPNPNHFARPGASGGGLSIFSAQLLAKSDFSIGGMPAEYGNAIAGVFDIKFREGNSNKHQHFIRAGVLGLDLSTEGPIKKGRSSYLINYRYSTLGLLNQIKINIAGERTLNTFLNIRNYP